MPDGNVDVTILAHWVITRRFAQHCTVMPRSGATAAFWEASVVTIMFIRGLQLSSNARAALQLYSGKVLKELWSSGGSLSYSLLQTLKYFNLLRLWMVGIVVSNFCCALNECNIFTPVCQLMWNFQYMALFFFLFLFLQAFRYVGM